MGAGIGQRPLREEKRTMTRAAAAMGMAFCLVLLSAPGLAAREHHVSVTGDDESSGSPELPLRTISAAASRAQPGDVVTVHAGTYRERVTPPRGGTSDEQRITYRAAPGEEVVIKGSEEVDGWEKAERETWRVTIDNRSFGDFNPYTDLIDGDWFEPKGREHHTGAVYLDEHWLTEAATLEDVLAPAGDTPLWFARVDEDATTIWAQFEGVDPNEAQVEINVRQTVFYPAEPGVDYITVRGFTLMHAATPWAPPTAEQIGLIGTHWSKGWIIEDNHIRYSTCAGLTLGKYGDQFDNTSEDTATGYVETIERALRNGWSADNIGHHVVRHNEIAHCEQAGLVGSLGAIFSTITGNDIHDIHVRRLFTGAEMAGIKIHAAVDTLIAENHIYRTQRGIWLDWMAQGARVTRNLLHDNDGTQDLFFEVNHGPFMVDHNVCLSVYPPRGESHWQSRNSVLDVSQGGAYAHNLFANGVRFHDERTRDTPFLEAHGSTVAGLENIAGGDNRFYGNLLVHHGLADYDEAGMPSSMKGNVYLAGARPARSDRSLVQRAASDPEIELTERPDGLYLEMTVEPAWANGKAPLVTTYLLGHAKIPGLPYLQPDRAPYRLDRDYHGRTRDAERPFPGPFEVPEGGRVELKVWPVASPASSPADRRGQSPG
jgi:alpha-N-arabinofuranosidase